ISKTVDIYDLLDNDELERLEELVEEEKAQKYDKGDFTSAFRDDLVHDLNLLKDLRKLWNPVSKDPKLDCFLSLLKEDSILKKNKLVVFTESKETGDYLFEKLNQQFPEKILFFSSRGGRYGGEPKIHNNARARELICENFDPNEKEQKNNIRILITTDILAEGINLHRSNTLLIMTCHGTQPGCYNVPDV
ncbi:MAG: helicase-related protein, partial [Nitrospinota bacterium]